MTTTHTVTYTTAQVPLAKEQYPSLPCLRDPSPALKGDMMIRRKQRNAMQRQRNQEIDEMRAQTVCPYFEDVTTLTVVCSSLIRQASTATKFKEKSQLCAFHKAFCCDLRNMQRCPQHKLLTLYYNTRDARREAARAERLLEKIRKP